MTIMKVATGLLEVIIIVITACACGPVLAIIISLGAVLLGVISIIAVPLLPLLLVFYFTTHVIQLVKSVADNDEVTKFRAELACWISTCFHGLTTSFFICMLIFMCSPSLKHRTLHDLPVWKWMAAMTIICLFCSLNANVRYNLPLKMLKRDNDKVRLCEGLMGLINCGLFLLAEFSTLRVAPVFEKPTILGFQVTKWVQVILVVLVGHNGICTVTSLGVIGLRRAHCLAASSGRSFKKNYELLRSCFSFFLLKPLHTIWNLSRGGGKKKGGWEKYVVYYAEGLRRSFNFVLTSFLFLLTWILYFGSRLDKKSPKIKEAYDHVMWTFVCVFVISILWLVKKIILLSRLAHVVYNRFHDDILKRSTQLWLLGILGGPNCDILNIWKTKEKKEEENSRSSSSWSTDLSHMRNMVLNICGMSEEKETNTGDDDHEDKSAKEKETQTPENTDVDGRQRKLDIVVDKKRLVEDGNEDDHKKPEASSSSPTKEKTDHGTPVMTKAQTLDEIEEGEIGNKASRQKTTGTSSDRSTKSKKKVNKARQVLSAPADYLDNDKDVPPHLIMRMASYFLAAEHLLSQKNYVTDFLKYWNQNKPAATTPAPDSNTVERPPIEDLTHKKIREKDEEDLRNEWQDKNIEKWLNTAHKTNLALARGLSGAKEVVDVLNNLISFLILGIMIVLWLLFTGIATKKVIVLIASPILAVSFIFGNTCKTFFEGIIFMHALHQFNVGDICTIADGTQVEVKRVGIWKTIFSKIGSGDEVIYPNSALSTKPIVNHKADVDPNDDCVELSLGPSFGRTEIETLKQKIESYLDKTPKFKGHPLGVVVKELGDPVKLGVHFKYDETKLRDMLPAEALANKTKWRDELLLEIKSYIDHK